MRSNATTLVMALRLWQNSSFEILLSLPFCSSLLQAPRQLTSRPDLINVLPLESCPRQPDYQLLKNQRDISMEGPEVFFPGEAIGLVVSHGCIFNRSIVSYYSF